ncbi:MAG: UDP-N-acetylglucosamine 1-carboxyvinyltransferase [Oscillospiraceae bacterium]|jgi:UDP-N-acetylglucosamine 1-carboxyvinyltransferase|nr:UDP-N-acetylglucosamine 1-carboxyvinyltransferase [Oscillospiraceae bacterium]
MSVIQVVGGRPLNGSLRIQGAKNSVLPILAATLLVKGETVITNCPNLSDVDAAIAILNHIGCKAGREGESVIVDSRTVTRADVPHELMSEMRSSVIFMGAMLARMGEAKLSLPGGCELGPRPVDMHMSALRALGAEIEETGGNIVGIAKKLTGCNVNFRFPSVGATENAMLAACGADGVTVITNAAREPEICDLADFLRKLGMDVQGEGTPTIMVRGRPQSAHIIHRIIPDRIVAATYLAAAAAAGGEVELIGVNPEHVMSAIEIFREMGCHITESGDRLTVKSSGSLKPAKAIETQPYPGFPTDMQPPIMAAALKCAGTTVFVENIFENRYRHAEEMRRLGADIKIEGRVAIVTGGKKLAGAPVKATDLRGGAALVVAALWAEGITEVSGIAYIDRGYDNITGSLGKLGASIERVL